MAWRGTPRILAVAAMLCLAAAAQAQNMFYREEAKDGRIYVFATMAAYQSWAQSNEMGKSTTRTGYGPNGETVVFDSDDAINLYNFKHDKPGEVFPKPAEPPKPAAEPIAKIGGTIFAEYVYTSQPKGKDAAGNNIHPNAFEVRRAYINVTGSISDLVSYRITPDIAARQTTTASGLPAGASVSSSLDGSLTIRLKYAYGQVNFDRWMNTKGSWVRFGQQQTPYVDWLEGVYRYRFEGTIFVEREGYLSSSDVGLSGRWVAPRDYGEVHVGIYNGDTYSKAEANDQKAGQLRATLRPLPHSNALHGLRLTGFVDGDRPISGGDRNRAIGTMTYEHKYAVAGFEYLWAEDRPNASAALLKSDGFSAWVTPRTPQGIEALLRFDRVQPNNDVDAYKEREVVGLAYWFKTLKSPLAAALMAEYEHVHYDGGLGKPEETRYSLKSLFNF